MDPTLIIDADDTLWENNIHYEDAIDRFLELVEGRNRPKEEVRALLMDVERANIRVHGYGTDSFRQSLIDTLERTTGGPPNGREIRTIDELTHGIANMNIDFLPGVKETLPRLRKHFRLILFTKGDLDEQQRKVDRSGVARFFDHVELTTEKDKKAYVRLVDHYTLDPTKTWMVGNSPRSDINPAIEAGLNAILIPHPRTWELEHEDVREDHPEKLNVLERFTDLLSHFSL
jgi:putative hydrolase of the HAD superfamily